MKSTKGYWYLWFVGECPVCGRRKSYRERRYTPKPVHPGQRIVLLDDAQTYDYCGD